MASHVFRLPHQLSLNWSLQICLSSTTGQKGPRLEPQVGFHFAFNCRESINTGTFSETFKVYRLLIFFFSSTKLDHPVSGAETRATSVRPLVCMCGMCSIHLP